MFIPGERADPPLEDPNAETDPEKNLLNDVAKNAWFHYTHARGFFTRKVKPFTFNHRLLKQLKKHFDEIRAEHKGLL
jgi:hypothetical protein